MALQDVLATIPGLGGYLGMEQFRQQQSMQGLQGLLGAANMVEQQKARQAQVDLLRQELALKQLAERRQQSALDIGIGLLRGGSMGSPVQAALTEGANQGDIGPTVTNAQRMTTQPSQQGGVVRSLTPDQILGLGIAGIAKPADIVKLREMGRPKLFEKDGMLVAQDMDTGKSMIVGTIPSVNQQGFGFLPQVDPSVPGGVRIEPAPGAISTYGAQQRAGEESRAAYDLVKVKMPDGTERTMSRLQAAQLAQGSQTAPLPQPTPSPAAASGQETIEGALAGTQHRLAEAQRVGDVNGIAREQENLRRLRAFASGAPQLAVTNMPGFTEGKPTQQRIDETAQETGAKKEAENASEQYNAFRQRIGPLNTTIGRLRNLQQMTQSDLTFSNAGAQWKMQLSSLAQALGMEINVEKLGKSEAYMAEVAELMKERLASKDYGSGTGVSNLDLIAAMQPLPEIAKSKNGRLLIIDALSKDAKEKLADINAYRAWYESNRGNMRGFSYPSEAIASQRLQQIEASTKERSAAQAPQVRRPTGAARFLGFEESR